MELRIKKRETIGRMVTPYGTVTKAWTVVPDGSYVYSELEVRDKEEWEKPGELIEEVVKVIPIVEKPVVVESELDDLINIKGIGKKIVKDIKRQYNDINELIADLNDDKVSLRDDVVSKLKRELL